MIIIDPKSENMDGCCGEDCLTKMLVCFLGKRQLRKMHKHPIFMKILLEIYSIYMRYAERKYIAQN